MLGRKPVFPGSDTLQQLRLIVNKVGVNAADLDWVPHRRAAEYVRDLAQASSVDTDWKVLALAQRVGVSRRSDT